MLQGQEILGSHSPLFTVGELSHRPSLKGVVLGTMNHQPAVKAVDCHHAGAN